MADLSVIIVNYNSGWYCSNLVDSLLDQDFQTPAGDPGTLEIVVVDNASPEDQGPFLDPLGKRGVRVIRSERNLGYGGGNNLGMRFVSSDWLMICNPDVVFMPGSMKKLVETLYGDPRIAMVGPRGWLDPGFHFLLPPVEMPTLHGHLYEAAGRVFKPVGRRFSLARSRFALRYWNGEGAMASEVISGFGFLMPAALARAFGPFDKGFPFYYEDNDLCLRLTRAGYRLLFVKDTRVVHFYNKSAGPVFAEVIEKYHQSKSYFFAKHYGRVRHLLYRAATSFLQRNWSRLKGAGFDPPEDLGELPSPPELPLPPDRPVLVEITLDPAYVLAAGHLHQGGPYRMPDLTWDALDANTWYLRFLDPSCRELIGSYKWKKTTEPVLPPLYGEMKERMP